MERREFLKVALGFAAAAGAVSSAAAASQFVPEADAIKPTGPQPKPDESLTKQPATETSAQNEVNGDVEDTDISSQWRRRRWRRRYYWRPRYWRRRRRRWWRRRRRVFYY